LKAADTNGIDRRLAADAATGGDEEVALLMLALERRPGQLHLHQVAGAVLALGEGRDLLAPADDPFREQEPGGELGIMARSAHRHRERRAVHSNLERLLGDDVVVEGAQVPLAPFRELHAVDAARARAHRGAARPETSQPGPLRVRSLKGCCGLFSANRGACQRRASTGPERLLYIRGSSTVVAFGFSRKRPSRH
jgi:hypothetical protein